MLIERMRKRLSADRSRFIEPCLPSPAERPPSGSNWIHEIKHDGFRLIARRDPVGIRLITSRGNDSTNRYPLVVEAVNHLKVRSCLIDGEVVCCDEKGVAAFQLLRHRRNELKAILYALDLLELNGADLRRVPIEVRKATLAILRKSRHGVRLNEHPDGEGVFRHPARWARGDRRPGDVRFGYYPLHGAPRMYYSAYDCAFVAELAVGIRGAAAKEAWCIFDNTASGAATANALAMQTQVTNAVRKASP